MDAPPREAAPERVGQSASEWVEEFKGRSLEVQRAADEWAVRWQEPEGRFVSALLPLDHCRPSPRFCSTRRHIQGRYLRRCHQCDVDGPLPMGARGRAHV
jgi:hypothetical protein